MAPSACAPPAAEVAPSRLRRIARRVFVAVVIVGQLYFIHRGYSDPHKHFAFQPFNESDAFHATIVRVTHDGRRVPVTHPWHGYSWDQLVRSRGFYHGPNWRHATSGIRSILDFFEDALNWAAEHTPNDPETLYYEAVVTYTHNRRGPYHKVLRSRTRTLPPTMDAAPTGQEVSQ